MLIYIDFLYFLVFALGTVFGSFLNVVSDRLINGDPIIFGRSKCDHCEKVLASHNLIPIVSFFLQRGQCEKCKARLSFYYPLSEFITGAAFLFAAYYSSIFRNFDMMSIVSFLYLATVLSFFVIILLSDAKYRIIPDKVVLPAIVFVFLAVILFTLLDITVYREKLMADNLGKYLVEAGFWKQYVWRALQRMLVMVFSAFGIAMFFWSIIIIWEKIFKHEGMGYGDIKLGLLIGLFNGFPNNILAIFLGFMLGAIYSVFYIIVGKKTVKDTIPFGPFLILGSLVAFLWGEAIYNWYFGLFNLLP